MEVPPKIINMEFPIDQIEELKRIYPNTQLAQEGGFTFFLLLDLELPEGCVPSKVDALLCPMPRDGYISRLFFSSKINGRLNRNWNGNARILDQTWFAISWKISPEQRLIQMIRSHLDAFRT